MALRQLWCNLKHDGVIEEEEELGALELYENILKQTVWNKKRVFSLIKEMELL